MATTLYVLRHARTTPSPAYAPDFDWPLDEVGAAQARQLVPTLSSLGIDGVFCSPQRRAVGTVAPFAEASGCQLHTVDGLSECAFNRVWQIDFLGLVRSHWDDFGHADTGCESHRTCQRRILEAIHGLMRSSCGTVLCCTGGQAIGLTLHSIDAAFGFDDWRRIRTPDLFRLTWRDGRLEWDRDVAFDVPGSPPARP